MYINHTIAHVQSITGSIYIYIFQNNLVYVCILECISFLSIFLPDVIVYVHIYIYFDQSNDILFGSKFHSNNTNYYGEKKTPKNRKEDRKKLHTFGQLITNPVDNIQKMFVLECRFLVY